MELRIDPEFEGKIPPLTAEEFQQLENNILADGVVINPIIVWDGVIVDGHNRYRIVSKHPEIQFSTCEKTFADRYEAIAWICKNQLGRRNLTKEQKKYLIGKQYEAEKASHGGDRGNQYTNLASCQIGNLPKERKTCERIAEENGISSRSVCRAEAFSKAVDIADAVEPGIRDEILAGKIKPTEKDVHALARADPEERPAIIEEMRKSPEEKRKRSLGMKFTTSFKTNSKALWSAGTVIRVLKNPIYTGVLIQGKETTPSYKVHKRVTKDESEWSVIEDSHEAIISKIDFDSVQKVLKCDTRRSPGGKAVGLFSGMIFCGDCGASMVRKTVPAGEKKYVYYICSAHKQDKSCSPHRIRDITLEEIVLDSLKQHISEVVDMSELLEITDTAPLRTAQAQKVQRQLDKKHEEYEKLQKLLMSLYENLADDIIDREEYTRLKASFTVRADEGEKQMDALREQLEDIHNHGTENIWMNEFIKRQGLTTLDRAVVVALIDKILIHSNDAVEIIYRWQDEFAWQLDILRSARLREVV